VSVQVRPLVDRDFFTWLGLFEGYSDFYKSTLTDEKALRVWSWITDRNHELEGSVAVDDSGDLLGFVHYRQVPRTLDATRGLFLDDLFVVPGSRGNGVGRALMDFATQYARDNGLTQVQWVTAADNKTAQRLYAGVGTKTDWVTYEIEL
jgi:GNAT superfamily N-acetyltransferase